MSNSQENIKNLFLKATNLKPVKLSSNVNAGNFINVNIGYGTVKAQCLYNIKEGDAIAFQTDQGNWYLIGNQQEVSNGYDRKQISYRSVKPKVQLVYPVATLFSILGWDNTTNTSSLTFHIGGNTISKTICRIDDYSNSVYVMNLTNGRIIKYKNDIYTHLILYKITGKNQFNNPIYQWKTISNFNKKNKALYWTSLGNYTSNYFESTPSVINPFKPYKWQGSQTNKILKGITEYDVNYTEEITGEIHAPKDFEYVFDKKNLTVETLRLGNILSKITLTGSDYKDTVEGQAVITFTSDGEIVQDFKGSIEYKQNYRIADTQQQGILLYNSEMPTITTTERNIIKLRRKNGNSISETILNTSDFGIIYTNTSGCIVSTINRKSTNFTITVPFTSVMKTRIDNLSGRNNTFNADIFANDYIYSCSIDNIESIIKGTVISAEFIGENFVVDCSINQIYSSPTSLINVFFIDNGSFYNYLFIKALPLTQEIPYSRNIPIPDDKKWSPEIGTPGGWLPTSFEPFGRLITKDMIPLICLNPCYYYLFGSTAHGSMSLYNIGGLINGTIADWYFTSLYITREKLTDNIVKNKIYSVVKVDKDKAWIEQWDIKDNGDVKYNKVFQVDYVPLKKPNEDEGEVLSILAHSYYPT